MTDNNDTIERVSTGVSIKAEVKRGSGTRDQDKIVFKAKGTDAKEASEELEESLQALEEHGWDERLRELQPGDGGD